MSPRDRSETTTLYLRNVPAALVRAAKVKAAREGTTLTAVVIEALARSVRGRPEKPSSQDDELRESMRWYEANRDRLLREYDGQYVAIVDGEVIDRDQDFEALATRVFERRGVRPIFMPRVTAAVERARVRSPRRRVS